MYKGFRKGASIKGKKQLGEEKEGKAGESRDE